MKCPRFLPWIGWVRLDAADLVELRLDLDPGVQWEALSFEWFGRGAILCARPAR